ncbi:MAG: glycosyltransferase family 39 protein [Candidatus Curtissbacteria bacterium]|nr:glycosyltransferase family 39 protein [Candidatus Curtissbacteria bacterium]
MEMFSLAQNYVTRGFWGDEAWTSLISQLPYSQMLKTTAADFHPPGYYTVVGLVYRFFPPTEIATRLISVFFYLLTILVVYKFASEFKGKTFGLLSALVLLVNPIFLTYAFEARNYTMFAFASVSSVYFLNRLSSKFNFVNVIGFVLFSALGLYTHYYMLFVLAAEAFYILLFDRKILIKSVGLFAVVGALFLPWVPFLLSQVTSVGESYWIGGIDERTHFEAVLRILAGEHFNPFQMILFAVSTALIVLGLVQHIRRRSFEKPYALIWLWAVMPLILASLPGLKVGEFRLPFRPIFFWRYLIPAAVPFSMIIVHSAQKFPGPFYKLSITAVIVLSLAIDYLTLSRYPLTFKQIYAQEVVPQIQQGDKIVTVLPSFAEVLYYRNRNGLTNELVVLSVGLVQFSGKSLLDAYVANGVVKIQENVEEPYFYLSPGPKIEVRR